MSTRDDLMVELTHNRCNDDEAAALLDAHRAEILAEAKVETVAWLVKKAAEGTDVGDLASKVDRGAVRAFLGTAHYRDAMDEHRAEVLAEASAVVDAMLTEEPDTMRASALYEALLKIRSMQPCTCARSWGLHEKNCRKYVPGHELLSPTNALAAYRSETRNR